MSTKDVIRGYDTICDLDFEEVVYIYTCLTFRIEHYRVMIMHCPPEDTESLKYWRDQVSKAAKIRNKIKYMTSGKRKLNG